MSSRLKLDIAAVGQRIRASREEHGLDQQQLADAAGLSRAYISRLENGVVPHPKMPDLLAVADALRVSLNDLVYGRAPTEDQAETLQRALLAFMDPVAAADLTEAIERFPAMTPAERLQIITAAVAVSRHLLDHRRDDDGTERRLAGR